jgi:hypothetical protein
MAYHDYIQLNGKKYKVSAMDEESFVPVYDRQTTDEVSLTGLTIMQDFTVANRAPREWRLKLRVFINDPWPDNTFGVWADLLAVMAIPYVTLVEHDDTQVHEVRLRSPLVPSPRVPANIDGHCHGIFFVDVNLVKVYR